MTDSRIHQIAQMFVDYCSMTVLIQHSDGRREQRSRQPPGGLESVWEIIQRFCDRVGPGNWAGVIQNLYVRDRDGRAWILHVCGTSSVYHAVLAIGPLLPHHALRPADVMELLEAPLEAPSLPGDRSGFRELRRDLMPGLLEAIRQGDQSAVEDLLSQFSQRGAEAYRSLSSLQAKVFLLTNVTRLEEATIQGGVDLASATELGEQYSKVLMGSPTAGAALAVMFSLIRELVKQVTRVPFQGTSVPTRTMIRFLQERLDQPLTLTQAAQAAGLSPSYAGSLLSRETGRGFLATLHSLRIDRARVLLRTTSLSVAEVARVVGYRHPNHFSRVFRAQEGCNPREYQRLVW